MRFLLPLPTQREQRTGREGGNIAPIDRRGDWRPLGGVDGYVWAVKNSELERGGPEPRAQRQRCDKRWMPWFMGSSARLGKGQFPLTQFGLTVKALWRPTTQSIKKKRSGETLLYSKHMSEIGPEKEHCAFVQDESLSHRSPHFPSSIILLVTEHLDTEKILFFHIIGMRNGLELNSITYSNPQTNKSNIAQGKNAFYVSKSQTKEQAIKRFHSVQYFLSYFL